VTAIASGLPGSGLPGSGLPAFGETLNRLADETSPYLLQHAGNPVHWYPWGPEALDLAKREKKPIFLSIGYSSCHWCHVMEHESFTDEEIAGWLNEHFVCIKVDREERPDIDAIYMTAIQIMTGRGGWPLSAFLTPRTKPFFGGTYFPARDGDRPQSVGFLTVLKKVHGTWLEQKPAVLASANKLTSLIQQEMAGVGDSADIDITHATVTRAIAGLDQRFDPDYGGFGFQANNSAIPKFPQGSTLLFLLEQAKPVAKSSARTMALKTLDHLAWGGMRDHIGGGFHRYSVDRFWNIPHFEKMLYDNGQLLSALSRAYALTGNQEYRWAIDEAVEFLNREMSSPDGGFYSALDADSEGEEGLFYVWKQGEWAKPLTKVQSERFAQVYATSDSPNFEGKYYQPLRDGSWTMVAKGLGMNAETLHSEMKPIRSALLDYRSQRVRPRTDTKVLTAWNGLAIRGLADAGRYLDEPRYVQRAKRCADFIWNHLRDDDGRLFRSYNRAQAKLPGYVDDYAFFVDGLIALHDTTGEPAWLEKAMQLQETQNSLFLDELQGGFFFTAADQETLLVRGKLLHEGARPSGAATTANNLIALAKLSDRPEYLDMAEKTIQSATELLDRAPRSVPTMLTAISRWLAVQPDSSPASATP